MARAPVLRTTKPVFETSEFPGRESIMEEARSAGGCWDAIRDNRKVWCKLKQKRSENVDGRKMSVGHESVKVQYVKLWQDAQMSYQNHK